MDRTALLDKAWTFNNDRCRCVKPLIGRVYFRQKQCSLCGGFINAHTPATTRVRNRESDRSQPRVADDLVGGAGNSPPLLGRAEMTEVSQEEFERRLASLAERMAGGHE